MKHQNVIIVFVKKKLILNLIRGSFHIRVVKHVENV